MCHWIATTSMYLHNGHRCRIANNCQPWWLEATAFMISVLGHHDWKVLLTASQSLPGAALIWQLDWSWGWRVFWDGSLTRLLAGGLCFLLAVVRMLQYSTPGPHCRIAFSVIRPWQLAFHVEWVIQSRSPHGLYDIGSEITHWDTCGVLSYWFHRSLLLNLVEEGLSTQKYKFQEVDVSGGLSEGWQPRPLFLKHSSEKWEYSWLSLKSSLCNHITVGSKKLPLSSLPPSCI